MKVTLATACMNRLGHLSQTMIPNLEGNTDPEVEFLLLNYNSTDRLDEWVKTNLKKYIDAGRLNYYHERTVTHWHFAHARNVMIRAASGEIFCNVDADNRIGDGFGTWLRKLYETAVDKVFTAYPPAITEERVGAMYGRVSARVKHLKAIGGYDEVFSMYGCEDADVVRRLVISGLERVEYPKQFWLKPIPHEDVQRYGRTVYAKDANGGDAFAFGRYLYMCQEIGGRLPIANSKGCWGQAVLVKNWTETITVPVGYTGKITQPRMLKI